MASNSQSAPSRRKISAPVNDPSDGRDGVGGSGEAVAVSGVGSGATVTGAEDGSSVGSGRLVG